MASRLMAAMVALCLLGGAEGVVAGFECYGRLGGRKPQVKVAGAGLEGQRAVPGRGDARNGRATQCP